MKRFKTCKKISKGVAWSYVLEFLQREDLLHVALTSLYMSILVRHQHRRIQCDISHGQETIPVPVINHVDNELYPGEFYYATETKGSIQLPRPTHRSVSVSLFKSKTKGWCLQTNDPIDRNTYLGEYVGQLVRTKSMNRNSRYIVSIREEADDIVWRINVDAMKIGNFTRFINHSCQPNAAWDTVRSNDIFCPRIHVTTLRSIQAGEEITVDYGVVNGFGTTPCHCGATNCKKFLPFDPTL